MTVTSVETVAAGAYELPGNQLPLSGMNLAGRYRVGADPAFCRFAATLRASIDSDIRKEVWLIRSTLDDPFHYRPRQPLSTA